MSDLKTQLKEQIAEIDWKDLIPHAQRDAIILVDDNLDLIEVGSAIALNDTKTVENWISEQLIQKPNAEQLSHWNSQPTTQFTTIIVQPFVLIKSCH
ncbi:DUF2288 domain-containing protein [Cyanobacterium stanieri LEGE 03274]|uniref:DUF2288 domain-containing protein n=1 Tax=Cyanobacterium stanieri LEGE 03274 TaxID=1828756 RepID=A0ABR9V1F9_9CHRO|nr:DUF2288 domain-containing protein [Cyanobacterium stanieri]MBE9221723.1 DUF2288 domain-containing protein [Cyanobacterium stanieri LEGE 03274]